MPTNGGLVVAVPHLDTELPFPEAAQSAMHREAFHEAASRARTVATSAARVGYAIRWLELRRGECLPDWSVLLVRDRGPAGH